MVGGKILSFGYSLADDYEGFAEQRLHGLLSGLWMGAGIILLFVGVWVLFGSLAWGLAWLLVGFLFILLGVGFELIGRRTVRVTKTKTKAAK